MRTAARWIVRSLIAVIVLLVIAVAVALYSLDTSTVRSWARVQLVKVLTSALGAEVSIGRVARLGLGGITLEQVSIRDGGEPVIEADTLELGISIASLAPITAPRIALELDLVDPTVKLVREPDGRWNLVRIFASGEAEEPEEDTGLVPSFLAGLALDLHGGTIQVSGIGEKPIVLSNLATKAILDAPLLSDPIVTLESLAVKVGEASELRGTGTLDLGGAETATANLELAPLDARDLVAFVPTLKPEASLTGTVSLTGTLSRPELDVDVKSGASGLQLAALLEPAEGDTPERIKASFRAEALDPSQFLIDVPPGQISGQGEVDLVPGVDLPSALTAQIELVQSRFADLEVESLRAHAVREGENLVVELDGATPGDGVVVTLNGSVGVTAPHPVSAQADLTLHDPAALPESVREALAETELTAHLLVEAADPMAEIPTGKIDLTLDQGRLRGVQFLGAELRATFDPNQVRAERIAFQTGRSNLEGTAQVDLIGTQEEWPVRAMLSGPLDLALLEGSQGLVDVKANVGGRVGALDARLDAVSTGKVQLPGFSGTLDASAEARALGSTAPSANVQLTSRFTPQSGVARVIGEGERPAKLAAVWSRSEPSAGRVIDKASVSMAMGKDEKDEQRLEVKLQRDGETTTIELDDLAFDPSVGPRWALEAPATILLSPAETAVRDLRLDSGSGRIAVDGRLASTPAMPSDMRVNVTNLELAPLCSIALAWEGCAGELEAGLVVSGTAARRLIRLDVKAHELEIAEQRYDEFSLTAQNVSATTLSVEGLLAGMGGRLRLDGSLPLSPGEYPSLAYDRDMRIEVRAENLQMDAIRALTGPAVSQLDGQANGVLMVGGSMNKPDLSGSLQVDDLTVGIEAAGAVHKNGRIAIDFSRERIELTELDLDQGAITAGGSVDLAGDAPARLDLWVSLQAARLLDRPEITAEMSGRITLDGAMEAPQLAGNIVVNPATIRPTLKAGGGPPIDPTIQVVLHEPDPKAPPWISGIPPDMAGPLAPPPSEEEKEEEALEAAPSKSFYDLLAIDVTVSLGDSVAVNRFDAYIRLSGSVYATKAPEDELRLTGEIDGRNGWYLFQGRRLEIREAYVTFSGETPINPYLSVEATFRSAEYLITARINGTVSHPALDLSSDPPLDQGDILAVLLFGKPASALSSGQGQALQQQAFALLASYVAPELQSSMFDTFGLTSITFSMPTGDTAGTLGVGRYIGDDIFISVAQDFGGPKGGTERQLQGLVGSSVTIQYFLTPTITLQGASSTQGESSVDAIWNRRY